MIKTNCNNCGKLGHQFHQCKLPITSYGIIVFKIENGIRKYLMIRRRDSFGYIDFVRGKYSIHNIVQLSHIINEMSIEEKHKILHCDFNTLWNSLSGDMFGVQPRGDDVPSSKKFELLKSGNDTTINLHELVNSSTSNWNETEWEFPKGRRNYQEKDIDCALREFEEETGYEKNTITVIENLLPLEEIFIGSNHKSYKHKYFLSYVNNEKDMGNSFNFQKSEVSKIEWKTLDSCLESIRDYNLEKKRIIQNIDNLIEEYNIY